MIRLPNTLTLRTKILPLSQLQNKFYTPFSIVGTFLGNRLEMEPISEHFQAHNSIYFVLDRGKRSDRLLIETFS